MNSAVRATDERDERMPLAAGMVFAATACAAVALIAMEATLAALAVILVDGMVAAVWVAAAAGVGHWIVRRATQGTHPALRFATSAAMGLGIQSLLLLALGLAGWLNRAGAWIIFFAGLALGMAALVPWLLRWKRSPSDPPPPSGHRWLWLVAGVGLGFALVGGATVPGILWRDAGDPHPYDALSYHLQVPREWYEAGRITSLQHNVFSHFPMGVEMHFLAGMHLMGGPWKGMYFAQFFNAAMAVVMVAGVYGAARTLSQRSGHGDSAQARYLAVLAAAAVASVPWVAMLSSIAYAEVGLMLFGAMAIAWVLIGMTTPGDTSQRPGPGTLAASILGGVFAGFACGTKYPAVPMLLLGVPVAMVAARSLARDAGARQPMPRIVGGAVAFVLSGLVVFSPWLVRNIAWTGNPVFPLALRMLGQGHFSDQQVERFERAHAAPAERQGAAGRAAAWGAEFAGNWAYGFVLVPAGLVLAAINWRSPRAIFLIVLLLWLSIIWLGFTHLIGRFMVLAIPLIGIVIGSLRPRVVELAIAAVMLVVVAVAGWVSLAPILARAAGYQAFGLPDLAALAPAEAEAAIASDQRIALIGDAQAFVYPVPMDRLSYRTVFDVPPGDPVKAWHVGAPPDVEIIVVPELQRLAATYAHIAPPPAEFAGRMIIVRPAAR